MKKNNKILSCAMTHMLTISIGLKGVKADSHDTMFN